MKGVVLAGGTGSRLHPLTRITNKHLLPLNDRPMISFAIEALVGAGVGEIMLVTGGTHAGEFLRLLGNGNEFGIDRLFYAYQDKAGGIAQALGLAEKFVAGDRCVVLLADNVFERSIKPSVDAFGKQARGARVVLSRESNREHLRNLGVPQFDGSHRIERIIEKPNDPPSEFAVTGVYFYDDEVWRVLPELKPSGRGELEITDVNRAYLESGRLRVQVLGRGVAWLDTGTHASLLAAANFVETIEARQGLKVCCPEEIAYRQGFIDQHQLRSLARSLGKSGYGDYLEHLIGERVF